jgi:preprotein translocase subunit SecD
MAVFAIVALAAIAASFLGSRVWSVFVSELQAAVRFEVRLAEDRPAPGLREAKVSGSGRSVYLHDEVIVTNSDIAVARVVPGHGPSDYSIGVEFNASGAEKMRAATSNHIGKVVAILLDGQVVMAPVLRTPIGASARISGNFTRTQAERIVNGIEIQ